VGNSSSRETSTPTTIPWAWSDTHVATATPNDAPEAARNAAANSPVTSCTALTRPAPRNSQPTGCSGRRVATTAPTVANASPLTIASRQYS